MQELPAHRREETEGGYVGQVKISGSFDHICMRFNAGPCGLQLCLNTEMAHMFMAIQ